VLDLNIELKWNTSYVVQVFGATQTGHKNYVTLENFDNLQTEETTIELTRSGYWCEDQGEDIPRWSADSRYKSSG
jgi:hypothetical protein